ncbi:MAG: PepSY domain-containing protein [Anaerolineae bacterium]|nr:PepSY domain-containing protein [Anaerolineae bacterium]
MRNNKKLIAVVIGAALIIGGLGVELFLTQRPSLVDAAPSAQQENDDNDSNEAGDTEDNGGNEAGEADDNDGNENETEETVSPDEAAITADQAKAAAEAANPGTKAVEVELEQENGQTAYEVELDNGAEVLVDAANGNVLGTDAD